MGLFGHSFHSCVECPTCKGKGKVVTSSHYSDRHDIAGHTTYGRAWCSDCKGSGRAIVEHRKCEKCRGRGFDVTEAHTVKKTVVVKPAVLWPNGEVRVPEKTREETERVPEKRSECYHCRGKGRKAGEVTVVLGPCTE